MEQIVGVLKQAEVGVPIAELIRKTGITEQTYYRWKAKYAGLEVDQVRQIKQLRKENTKRSSGSPRVLSVVESISTRRRILVRYAPVTSGRYEARGLDRQLPVPSQKSR